jgi:uncharacterized membrane protein YhaH (DUF805 family)/uncharacterized membrane protein YphA (DoxX/SURF4 family)
MKYAVWFVRLLFAAWMIPAGVNHFIRIFPQPMGNQLLSKELISALIDSNLFDLVKLVELVAGIGVLTGIYAPLAVLICVPVSFCVFFWDAPLEGWASRAARFGYATLLSNLLLCVAYVKSYASLFVPRWSAQSMKQLALFGRIILGAWMLANGINHFFGPFWAHPTGTTPHAVQLMDAFTHSGLLGVAMAIQLVAGALLLAGIFVPLALVVLMPVSTCALFWSLILEHRALGALLALVVFALNALLMFTHLDAYKGVLQRRALTLGESANSANIYDSLFARPNGRSSRGEFIGGLVTLLAVVAFYAFLVTGLTAKWCIVVLLIPATILLARRLHDMGRSAWPLVVPVALLIAAFSFWISPDKPQGSLTAALPLVAMGVAAAFALWGCLGNGQSTGNRFGPAVAG